jgi:ABC-type lipoprotein export system ATPase subunit
MSAWDNIQIKNQLTHHQTEDQISTMAERLEVASLLNKKCGEMSYGQRQRIAIIRALCQPFRFLIMDEPFAHLDSANVVRCCALIQEECSQQGAGFAVASLEERYKFEYDEILGL